MYVLWHTVLLLPAHQKYLFLPTSVSYSLQLTRLKGTKKILLILDSVVLLISHLCEVLTHLQQKKAHFQVCTEWQKVEFLTCLTLLS